MQEGLDFLTYRGREHIVVTDAKGAWVAGARPRGQTIEAQQPFTRTLTHLRVGFYREAIDARVSTFDDQWMTPLIITVFCVFLGLLALTSEVRASRRLRELLQRQRDFTTRVTHELKPPLAGIRVMAENLELGICCELRYSNRHGDAFGNLRMTDGMVARTRHIFGDAQGAVGDPRNQQ